VEEAMAEEAKVLLKGVVVKAPLMVVVKKAKVANRGRNEAAKREGSFMVLPLFTKLFFFLDFTYY
jgi:hypothetical protein